MTDFKARVAELHRDASDLIEDICRSRSHAQAEGRIKDADLLMAVGFHLKAFPFEARQAYLILGGNDLDLDSK